MSMRTTFEIPHLHRMKSVTHLDVGEETTFTEQFLCAAAYVCLLNAYDSFMRSAVVTPFLRYANGRLREDDSFAHSLMAHK